MFPLPEECMNRAENNREANKNAHLVSKLRRLRLENVAMILEPDRKTTFPI